MIIRGYNAGEWARGGSTEVKEGSAVDAAYHYAFHRFPA